LSRRRPEKAPFLGGLSPAQASRPRPLSFGEWVSSEAGGGVPELPEVESARSVIERAALGRTIVDVDDSDSYECRPHPPGSLRIARKRGEKKRY